MYLRRRTSAFVCFWQNVEKLKYIKKYKTQKEKTMHRKGDNNGGKIWMENTSKREAKICGAESALFYRSGGMLKNGNIKNIKRKKKKKQCITKETTMGGRYEWKTLASGKHRYVTQNRRFCFSLAEY